MSTAGVSLGWGAEVWDKIHKSVRDEAQRTEIADKILPINGPIPGSTNVPSHITQLVGGALSVDEGDITKLITLSCQFVLTKTQVEQEQQMLTALTLATRSANLISIALDKIVFNDSKNLPAPVQVKLNGNSGKGLLNVTTKSIPVSATGKRATKNTYGENTFAAVADGIASLTSDGFGGPYSLVLSTETYADTHRPPQANTLLTPATAIKALLNKDFYGTGILPNDRGLLLSLGGDTMDLTFGENITTEFMSYDNGEYHLQLYTRFAYRLKLPAVRILEFT